MIIKAAEFVKSAVKPSQYPPPDLPEIAFAGRSNVGKSSLINTLVNRRRLVKTSGRPGRTQLINFFVINDAIGLVDLPGYGYAKVPESIRRQWGPMIETYLQQRVSLRAVVLIVDIRRVPGVEELNFIDWLSMHRLACILVVTKCDKLSKTKQGKSISRISEALGIPPAQLLQFSAKTRKGRDAVWTAINEALAGEPTRHA
jgi:GTP-binding protein